MAPRVKREILSRCTLEEFLSEKLKKYIQEMAHLERSNLYDTVIGEVEKALIKIVVNTTDGNQLKAAKILGISRNTLREKMRQYKLGDYQSKIPKQRTKK